MFTCRSMLTGFAVLSLGHHHLGQGLHARNHSLLDLTIPARVLRLLLHFEVREVPVGYR